MLGVLAAAYEDQRWPIIPPDPVEAIEFHTEQNALRQKDLAGVLGSESRASEVLNRRRLLTLPMIRTIYAAWSIRLASLIGMDQAA